MSLTRSLRSQLASLYLRTGKSDKALEQLDIALSDITEQTDITSMVTTVRHLACYHMREDHADAAYHVLQNVLHKAAQRGFQRPTYLNGMVLELLEALHDRGFPPLPCYDFPQELQRCLNGPNRLLRGVALRLPGKQLAAAGQTAQAIEACRHSITLLDALHDALEAGKSRLLLAQLLLPEDEGKARLLLHEAWAVYPYLKHHFWPESLLPLIPRYLREGQDQAVSERSLLAAYREHFAPQRLRTSFESFLPILLTESAQILGAEHSCLFLQSHPSAPLRQLASQDSSAVGPELSIPSTLDEIAGIVAEGSPLLLDNLGGGSGAAAGIVLLMGGGAKEASAAMDHMAANLTGMICDGGSIGCALKASAGVYAAYLSAMLAMEGIAIPHNFGVIGSSAEQTEKNLGRISDEGMAPMDSTIIDVMQKVK